MHLEENIPLAPFTTLRIGGPARFFATVNSESDLLEAVRLARQQNLPIYILGGGSNLLVPDAGFPGLVLHLAIPGEIVIDHQPADRTLTYEVPAGHDWDAFVRRTCEAGLSGVECLAGIPGLVGGSPIQNIGAYGQEVAGTIAAVRTFDRDTGAFRTFTAAECDFAYRRSRFNSAQPNRFIVTRVTFRFHAEARPNLVYADLAQHFKDVPDPTPLQVYAAVRAIRDRKGMLIDPAHPHPDTRSAGSFFKNPIVPPATLDHIAHELSLIPAEIPHWAVPGGLPGGDIKLSAAWLIERAGFPRGFTLGPAGISSRHTLALINCTGTATCADLLKLRHHISGEVSRRFHTTLEQEPVVLA